MRYIYDKPKLTSKGLDYALRRLKERLIRDRAYQTTGTDRRETTPLTTKLRALRERMVVRQAGKRIQGRDTEQIGRVLNKLNTLVDKL